MNFLKGKADLFKINTDIFKPDVIKEGLKSLADPLKAFAKNAKEALLSNDPAKDQISDLIFIYPRVFWMTFPTKDKIKDLSNCLNTQFKKNNYYIWNLSEHTYDPTCFHNQVAEYSFVGYPCPPLQYIFLIVKSIIEWLNSDKENVAIIHCQSTKGRSALIISCLLSALKIVSHPMEALTYFCKKLHLNDTSFLFPSQNLYIKHFANVMDNIKLNKKTFILEKIVISEVPKLMEEKPKNAKGDAGPKPSNDPFRPYLQIFKAGKPIYNYLSKDKPKEYSLNDGPISFDIGVEISDDILIRCRHFKTNEERISVFRILFHPAFAFDEVYKLYKRDIDFSPNIETSPDFYVEFVLKQTENDNKDVEVIEKLRRDCQQISEEYKKRKEQPKKIVYESQEETNKKFDIDETSDEIKSEEKSETKEEEEEEAEEKPVVDEEKVRKVQQLIEENHDDGEDEEDLDDYIKKIEEKHS